MNLTDVVENLVDERGLDREKVMSIVGEGVLAAYTKRYPEYDLSAEYNKHSGQVEVSVSKDVVSSVEDDVSQITVRRARVHDAKAKVGSRVKVPFDKAIGRIEVLTAKQVIASRIRELEQSAVYEEYKEKEGSLITGTVHKRERAGYSVKIGDTLALLPLDHAVPEETLRVGMPIRVLLLEVLPESRGDYQLILDRASTDFVQKLIELEIPEVYEGIVEIRNVARKAGYKTKVIVSSNSSDIDPVGTCVGVGGSRIKPILREIGREKIDLIEWSDDPETLVKHSLKPAEVDGVEIKDDLATVWLAQDQRSYAIGRMGQNIALASRLTGYRVQLQDEINPNDDAGISFEDETEETITEE